MQFFVENDGMSTMVYAIITISLFFLNKMYNLMFLSAVLLVPK